MLKKLLQVAFLCSAALAFNAQAVFDMFLKLDMIDGESKDSVHVNEIEVLAWSWGLSYPGTTHLGGGLGEAKASFQDISITKYIDKSSPLLAERLATGAQITDAKLTVRTAGGEQVEYFIITMETVLVTSLSTGGGSGGEDRLTENITLNFAEYCIKYTPTEDNGNPIQTCFDIAGNVQP
jgi:type VI secretion system secreted protein Hcp